MLHGQKLVFWEFESQVVAKDFPTPSLEGTAMYAEACKLSQKLRNAKRPSKPLKIVIAGAGKLSPGSNCSFYANPFSLKNCSFSLHVSNSFLQALASSVFMRSTKQVWAYALCELYHCADPCGIYILGSEEMFHRDVGPVVAQWFFPDDLYIENFWGYSHQFLPTHEHKICCWLFEGEQPRGSSACSII